MRVVVVLLAALAASHVEGTRNIERVLNILDDMIADVSDKIGKEEKKNGVFLTVFDTKKNHYQKDIAQFTALKQTKIDAKHQTEAGIEKQAAMIADINQRIENLNQELSENESFQADLMTKLEKMEGEAVATHSALVDVEAKLKEKKKMANSGAGTFKGDKILNKVTHLKEQWNDKKNELSLKITNSGHNAESTAANYKASIKESKRDLQRQKEIKANLETDKTQLEGDIKKYLGELKDTRDKLNTLNMNERDRKLNYLKDMAKDKSNWNELKRANGQLAQFSGGFLQLSSSIIHTISSEILSLKKDAKQFKNEEFNRVADTIKFALSQQPSKGYTSQRCIFKPVIAMIDEMQSEINQEQQEDNKLNQQCQADLEKTMLDLKETGEDNRSARDQKDKAGIDLADAKTSLGEQTQNLQDAEKDKGDAELELVEETNAHRNRMDGHLKPDSVAIQKAQKELKKNQSVKDLMAELKDESEKAINSELSSFADTKDNLEKQINGLEVDIGTAQAEKRVAGNSVSAAEQSLAEATKNLEAGERRWADLLTTLEALDISCWAGHNKEKLGSVSSPNWDFEEEDDNDCDKAQADRISNTKSNHEDRASLRTAEKEALASVGQDLRNECKEGSTQRR